MKRWEKLAEAHLNDFIGINTRNIRAHWEHFADTGDCGDIHCSRCPFDIETCDEEGVDKLKHFLNEEVKG